MPGTEAKHEITPESFPPFQPRAWQWVEEQERAIGELPTAKAIAGRFGGKESRGRLDKG
ncbi:hypothetical protein KIK06_10380 [Nocardiopsis sp. EMB25]|uniref:hypothetical protein n=1 Tax=Nocardiopsis sp. EMB25 TaxID=2835867 RepID=UPI0022846A48|nr:hypothetical protein [Nocardiopsis sp. EMB25]MCY9784298.1 hypothetical protein [Nocardiopsis sp. EMB25]